MSARRARFLLALLPALAIAAGASFAAPASGPRNPASVLVIATSDLAGHITPCGCRIPKGGLGRQAGYVDSLRRAYSYTLVLDGGGYSAEVARDEFTPVTLAGLKKTGARVVGVGDADLAQGLSTLRARLKAAGLEAVCANLVEKSTGRTAFPPFSLQKVGPYTVGVLGLVGDRFDLGPSRDSIAVQDPGEVAAKLVPEMRAAGADAIVALTQLGKVGTEDLVVAVSGLDVVIAGRGVPLMQKGKRIGDTVVGYAGEQGQYAHRAELAFDAGRKITGRSIEAVVLGPEVRDNAALARSSKAFEDDFRKKHPGVAPAAADVHQHTH